LTPNVTKCFRARDRQTEPSGPRGPDAHKRASRVRGSADRAGLGRLDRAQLAQCDGVSHGLARARPLRRTEPKVRNRSNTCRAFPAQLEPGPRGTTPSMMRKRPSIGARRVARTPSPPASGSCSPPSGAPEGREEGRAPAATARITARRCARRGRCAAPPVALSSRSPASRSAARCARPSRRSLRAEQGSLHFACTRLHTPARASTCLHTTPHRGAGVWRHVQAYSAGTHAHAHNAYARHVMLHVCYM